MANPARILSTVVRLPRNEFLHVVSSAPGVLTAVECKQVIEMSRTSDGAGNSADPLPQGLRCETVRWILPMAESEWIFAKLESSVADINMRYGFDLKGFFEGAQVITLPAGGKFDWHMDLGTGRSSTRKLSALVQLNDSADYDGGDLQLRVADTPRADEIGALTVFPSYLEYRLRPVTRGERVLLLSWISGPAFR